MALECIHIFYYKQSLIASLFPIQWSISYTHNNSYWLFNIVNLITRVSIQGNNKPQVGWYSLAQSLPSPGNIYVRHAIT